MESCKAKPVPPTHALPEARATEVMWPLLHVVPTGEKLGGVGRAKNSAVNDTCNSSELVSQARAVAGPTGTSAPHLTAASLLKGGAVQGPSVHHWARLGVPWKAS